MILLWSKCNSAQCTAQRSFGDQQEAHITYIISGDHLEIGKKHHPQSWPTDAESLFWRCVPQENLKVKPEARLAGPVKSDKIHIYRFQDSIRCGAVAEPELLFNLICSTVSSVQYDFTPVCTFVQMYATGPITTTVPIFITFSQLVIFAKISSEG